MGGFAGEPDDAPGGLNPFGFPAQESVALLLLDAHRMLDFQSAELQKFATYRKLFRDAFPEEAAQADAAHDLNLLDQRHHRPARDRDLPAHHGHPEHAVGPVPGRQ